MSFFAINSAFFLFICEIKFLVIPDFTLKNNFYFSECLISLIQGDKVNSVCVALIEGYMRAGNRRGN